MLGRHRLEIKKGVELSHYLLRFFVSYFCIMSKNKAFSAESATLSSSGICWKRCLPWNKVDSAVSTGQQCSD